MTNTETVGAEEPPRWPVVVHDEAGERFFVREGADVAEVRYHRHGDHVTILHTGVPPALEGRGLGSALVRAVVELASAEGLTVVPRCPFARSWLEAHPDVAASVTIESP
ncbi:MAG TPA: GNAT family N-acetyltransferase [Acidimicrobiales bacterium]|nr:GNAT family N-acetyltransferase [Acidimicrobiales bacterium]